MSEEMTKEPAKPKPRKFECTISVTLPGATRPVSAKVIVEAYGNAEASVLAETVWRKAVEPRDIHIVALADVIQA